MEYKGVSNDKAIMISLDIIRAPYAWAAGYEKIAITDDGGVLCRKCVKENLSRIAKSCERDGWHVIDIVTLFEYYDGLIYCDHCGKLLNEED